MDSEIHSLYSEQDIEQMRLADEARMNGQSRVSEIKNYARLAGIKRIGIANCIAVEKEAARLKEMLEQDFEVYSIDCKCGKITQSEMLGMDKKGISCNPAGQAAYLSAKGSQLNISMGLCLGHDMVFSSKSQAPVTTLVVKDRQFKHHPIEALRPELAGE